jgi:hypothetical protein
MAALLKSLPTSLRGGVEPGSPAGPCENWGMGGLRCRLRGLVSCAAAPPAPPPLPPPRLEPPGPPPHPEPGYGPSRVPQGDVRAAAGRALWPIPRAPCCVPRNGSVPLPPLPLSLLPPTSLYTSLSPLPGSPPTLLAACDPLTEWPDPLSAGSPEGSPGRGPAQGGRTGVGKEVLRCRGRVALDKKPGRAGTWAENVAGHGPDARHGQRCVGPCGAATPCYLCAR